MYATVGQIDIHWCTISTPHPQWSSGYDFRVSIHRKILYHSTYH